jgi:hypothetical protein
MYYRLGIILVLPGSRVSPGSSGANSGRRRTSATLNTRITQARCCWRAASGLLSAYGSTLMGHLVSGSLSHHGRRASRAISRGLYPLDRIDESLLFEASDGSFWLSCVCSYEADGKGRLIVAQSVSKEAFAAGVRGPVLGTWRQIGGGNHASSGKPAFDLSKYQKPPTPEPPPSATGGTKDAPLFPGEEERTR